MYGPRFLRDYGVTAPPVWESAIRSMTVQQVANGLRRLAGAGSAAVPALPVFVKACRTANDDDVVRPASTFIPPPNFDKFYRFGQIALLRFLVNEDVSEAVLRQLIVEKNKLVEDFRAMSRDDEVPTNNMHEAFAKAFARVTRRAAA